LADLDETIRQLLVRRVPLDPAEVDVSFETPDREWSGRLSRPTVNCFLYDVRENHEYRATDWDVHPGPSSATIQRTPLRFDVTYQVSVWARAPEDEHRLLWRVLAVLAHHPVLPDDVAQGMVRDQPLAVQVKVAQPEQAPKNAADLWQVIDNRIRPSLTYVATLALDADVVLTTPLVFTRITRVRDRDAAAGREIPDAFQIAGRVHDRQGQPLAGVTVRLRESGRDVTTDEEGRFRIARAPSGEITLVVRAPGRPEVSHRTEVPSPSYDIQV
jgi:hypothetical protein